MEALNGEISGLRELVEGESFEDRSFLALLETASVPGQWAPLYARKVSLGHRSPSQTPL